MLAAERRLRIKEILSSQRAIKASELAEVLGVVPTTVRRDLAALEQEGFLVRSHGGAISRSSSTSFQPCYEALLRTNHKEKVAIAQEAAKLILDGDTIFLESSTTVFELARLLQRRSRLTVVTNAPAVLWHLHHSSGVTVTSTGGDLRQDIAYLCGVWTRRVLSEIRLDKAILGVTAIDPSYGMSAASHEEAEVKQLLIKAARQRIALADHTKFGKQSYAFVGPVTDINILVTDAGVDGTYVQQLQEKGIQVVIANAASRSPSE
jgi:DeoR family fructose operon transcriptional repressor